MWQCTYISGRIFAARPFSEQLLRLTQTEQDIGLRIQVHHSGWSTSIMIGELTVAREHADAGRKLYHLEKHRDHRLVYGGHDPGACARWIGALAEWLLGYPEKALASSVESLTLAERVAHPFTSILALTNSSVFHLNNRQPEAVLERLETAEALGAEQRLSFIIDPEIIRGAALVGLGASEEGIVRIQQGLTETRRKGATFYLPFSLAFLADALAGRGEQTAALAAARDGLEVASKTGEHIWDADLHRLAGLALVGCNRLDEGQSALREALRVARQHNRPNPLNCAPRSASRGCGASRAAGGRRATCSRPSTARSPKASTPPI